MAPALNTSVLLVLACLFISVCVTQQQNSVSGEEAVIKHLFLDDPTLAEANRIARPSEVDGSVKVTLGYSGISVTNFDEINGEVSLKVWEQSFWNDSRLIWNPDDYDGISKIFVPSKYIWLPDIVFYSTGSKEMNTNWNEETAVVSSDGLVYFIPVRILTFRCSMNIRDFPFDSQTCSVTLGSWVHHVGEMQIINVGIDSTNMENSHSGWNIKSHNLTDSNVVYECCPEAYQTLTLNLVLMRRFAFYYNIFITPAIVMFFILPALHLFPPGSSEKPVLAGLMLMCTLLLHFMLYQQIRGFAEDDDPKLVEHYQSLMSMIVVSICVSSLTSTLANAVNTSRRVPAVIRKVMNSVVGRVCCFRSPDVKGEFTQLVDGPANIRYDPQHDMAPIVSEGSAESDNHSQDTSALAHLIGELKYGRERRQLEMEWFQLALLIDRLALIGYFLYVSIGIGIMRGH